MTSLVEYRRLRKRDFALSRLSMFGLVGHQKVALARKPVRRLFALTGPKPQHLDVTFVTDATELARGAVDVTIRYLGATARRVRKTARYQLFADPADRAAPQRVWLIPPKGAAFAEVSFSRAVRGVTIALDGQLKLRADAALPTLATFDRVLASRDLTAMMHILAQLEHIGDRSRAQKLLARMRFLSRSREIGRKHANLRDVNHLLKFGPNYTVPGVAGLTAAKDVTVTYSPARLLKDQEAMPLGKALVADALRLYRELLNAGANTVEVKIDAGALAGLLTTAILKKSCPDLTVKVDWQAFDAEPHALAPWLRFDSGRSFLETPCGRVVHSVLNGKQRD